MSNIKTNESIKGNAAIVARGWEAVSRGDWDALLADYIEDLAFIMPGQNDVLNGKPALRATLNNLGAALPAGFEISAIRQVGDGAEVVSIVEWKSEKVPDGSQLSVLFKFDGDKVIEERWFVDTEQWKAAF